MSAILRMRVGKQMFMLVQIHIFEQYVQILGECFHVNDVIRLGVLGAYWALLKIGRPMIGKALVIQHVGIVFELFASVDDEPGELGERELEPVRFFLPWVRPWRVEFIPYARDVAVGTCKTRRVIWSLCGFFMWIWIWPYIP